MPILSVRERRRAETVREIKSAALAQLGESGRDSLSLRGVARVVGMSVQALYHYFDSRDALLTDLVNDAHHALADAVDAAAETTRGQAPPARRLAAAGAFRDWALAHPSEFLLLYGTPVPDFEPVPGAGTARAAQRLAAPFVDVAFGSWTAEELAAVPLPDGGESIADVTSPWIPLPPGALALLIEVRARMHGLVVLELLGQLHPLQERAGSLYAAAMQRASDELDAHQRRAGRPAPGRPHEPLDRAPRRKDERP